MFLLLIMYYCGLQVTNDTVPNSYNTELDNFVFRVPLSPPFTNVLVSCVVWGCYEESSTDSNHDIFPIDSVTCEYEGK